MVECVLMLLGLNTDFNVHVFGYSDSVEKEKTLLDNTVQLQNIVQYKPDLFITRLVTYSL